MRDNWPSNRVFQSYDAMSTIAVTLGTSSSIDPCASCKPDHAIEPWIPLNEAWYYTAETQTSVICTDGVTHNIKSNLIIDSSISGPK